MLLVATCRKTRQQTGEYILLVKKRRGWGVLDCQWEEEWRSTDFSLFGFMSPKTFPQLWMCCSSGEKPRLSKSGFMLRSGLVRATVLQFCGSQIWETSWGWGGISSPRKASLRLSSSESRTSNAGLKDGSGRRVGGGQFSFSRDWEVLEMSADSQTKKNTQKAQRR